MSTSIHLLTRITPRNFDHVSTFCAKTSQTFCGLIYTPLKIYLHSSYKNLQANIESITTSNMHTPFYLGRLTKEN